MSRRSQRCQARGRRALYWGCAIFWTVQLGVGAALDFLWPDVRFPSLTRTLTAIHRLDRTPDVVCLGSSRIGTTFRPQLIQARLREATGDGQVTTFNAGVDFADLPTAEFVLSRMLKEGVRPKIVVVEVSPDGLSARNRWFTRSIERYWNWTDVVRNIGDVWRWGGYQELLRTRAVPVFAFRDSVCKTIFGPFSPAAKNVADQGGAATPPNTGYPWESWMAALSAEPRPTREALREALRGFARQMKEYHVGGSCARALERLVRRCQQNDIAVILMATPVCSEQREFYTPEVNAVFLAYLRQMVETYDCRFVDYRDRLPDALLLDTHHATCEGGEDVSRQFVEEILAPVWLARTLGQGSDGGNLQTASQRGQPAPRQASRH